jgi:ribonuclease HI
MPRLMNVQGYAREWLVVEYRDERDLNIYTDGSSYQRPRRGGVGILYVTVDADGEERADPYPLPGFVGATNQHMELCAAIEALKALVTRRGPVTAGPYRRIVIWTDSMYLVDGYDSARFTWPHTGWMTRDGNPVASTPLWKELVKLAARTGKPVEMRWVKAHKESTHNKMADKLAKQSSKLQTGRRASVVKVRRKKTAASVDVGSVGMHGQRLTIRIVADELLAEHKLNKVKYEVMSKASPYYGKVDLIYSSDDIYLSAGHTYHVRVNADQKAPRVSKLFREIA